MTGPFRLAERSRAITGERDGLRMHWESRIWPRSRPQRSRLSAHRHQELCRQGGDYGQLSPPPHKSQTTSRAAPVARPFSIAHGRMHLPPHTCHPTRHRLSMAGPRSWRIPQRQCATSYLKGSINGVTGARWCQRWRGSPGLSAGSGALVALDIGTGLPATPSVASAEPSNFKFVLGDPARRA
jgi:hypothetical protein